MVAAAVNPIFAYSTLASADMQSIPEGKVYSVDVPGIHRRFALHTGSGTTLVTGTMWYNSPAELSGSGYATSMLSDGHLMITFSDGETVQATGRVSRCLNNCSQKLNEMGLPAHQFLSDETYNVIETLIETGSWRSTPQPASLYPKITPAVADLDHARPGVISIYNISAPLIQKRFTKKAGTGQLVTGTLMYTSPADLEGEQAADTQILDDKLVMSFIGDSAPARLAEFRSTDNFKHSVHTLNGGTWEDEFAQAPVVD